LFDGELFLLAQKKNFEISTARKKVRDPAETLRCDGDFGQAAGPRGGP
jgi:hypothetical protein